MHPALQQTVYELFGLETDERRILLQGTYARYAPTGHLIYAQANTPGTLLAAPFDPEGLQLTGSPVPLVEDVLQGPASGITQFSFSNFGTLVYAPGVSQAASNLVWVDRDGTETRLTEERRGYTTPRLSPDGKRLALSIIDDDGTRDIWIYDLETNSFNRLTFEGNQNTAPTWTPDSRWIIFRSTRHGGLGNLYRRLADGSSPAERLTESQLNQNTSTVAPDGSLLVYWEANPETAEDILAVPIEGERNPEILIRSPARDCCARFSPDGKWLAYGSNETGQHHVYVVPYPDADVKHLVSEEGGTAPLWSPDGKELFYRSGDQMERMMVASVQTEPAFSVSNRRVLFEGEYVISSTRSNQYHDIFPDGQRFVMLKSEATDTQQIVVVLNWFEELKQRVPVN